MAKVKHLKAEEYDARQALDGSSTHLGMVYITDKYGDDWGMVYGIVENPRYILYIT